MPKNVYFRTEPAVNYGPSAAMLLHEFVRLTLENKAKNQYFAESRYWVRVSMTELTKMYWFLSKNQIELSLKKLREDGALLVDNFNIDPWDRTSWYSPGDEILAFYEDYPWDEEE